MAKVIVMVRTSTASQSIEDQHKEMLNFCVKEGYKPKDIVWVEEQGASAAKVDNPYRKMIDTVKAKIEEDNQIDCLAIWHLNRLVRTEEIWVEIKSFFVSHQIQIISANPYLRLLAPDGSIDKGMELAAGLVVLLAKQEQEERKAKFKRAKSAMLKKGQYIGGNLRKYGYKVVDKAFVEDEEEGKVVRLVFDLYSTGQHSSYTLAKELNERGIAIDDRKIMSILSSVAYVGDEVSESGMHYPQIISRELFEKCREIRESNRITMKRGERLCLGAKLVKCPVCGATCTSNSKHYVCSRHAHHGPCSNGFALRQEVVDDLLWRCAYPLHLDYLMNLTEDKRKEYKRELQITEEKLKEAEKKMGDYDAKKARIVDTYLEGLIDKKTRDLRLSKLQDDIRVHQDLISSLQAKREAILGMLEDRKKDDYETFISSFEKMELEDKFYVIHQHIESLVGVPESFGKRDPRCKKENGVRITVTDKYGDTHVFMYIPKFYQGHNLYIWSGKKWVGDYISKVR